MSDSGSDGSGGVAMTTETKAMTKSTHPPVSQMVDAAIVSLSERKGSSLQAIKRFISANFDVNIEHLSPFIKTYLKGAVAKGHLLQMTGKGASGSFKLSDEAKKALINACKPPKSLKSKESKATKGKKVTTSTISPKSKSNQTV